MIEAMGQSYEELEVGAVYRSRHGRTVLEADNVWFTLLTLNTNPIHFDAEYAEVYGVPFSFIPASGSTPDPKPGPPPDAVGPAEGGHAGQRTGQPEAPWQR